MSRDFRPIDFRIWRDQFNTPSLFSKDFIDVKTGQPVYSDELIELAPKYPLLSLCGPSIFIKLVEEHLINHPIIQQIEDILEIKEVKEDKELYDTTVAWYNGKLVPGYYMDDNNNMFYDYIKERISKDDLQNDVI